jgi:hypothetical protein
MEGSAKYSGRGRGTEDEEEVGREPLDKALALSARVSCVGARDDNGSGSSDISGSEKLVKVLFRGSSAGGGARDLDALLELFSDVSCDRGDIFVGGVELVGCAG